MMICPNCGYGEGILQNRPFNNITLDGPTTITNLYSCPDCGVFFFDLGYVPDKPNIDVKKEDRAPWEWDIQD